MAVNTISATTDSRHGPAGGGGSSDQPRHQAARFTVAADISALASSLSLVATLRQDDREQFKRVMCKVAEALHAEAARTGGEQARTLGGLAARFQVAAETGEELMLQPAEPADDHLGPRRLVHRYEVPGPSSEPEGQEPSLQLAGLIEDALREARDLAGSLGRGADVPR